MFKRLSERFPAAATRLEAYTAAGSDVSAISVNPEANPDSNAEIANSQDLNADTAPGPLPTLFGEESRSLQSDDPSPAISKTSLTERFNSETMSAAAFTMMGFMQKAKEVATTAAKEGADKARKVLDAADMDALQRRLSYALDRSTGEVNLELLNFSYISDNLVAMGFPSMNSGTNRTLLKDNPIDLVAMYLNDKHNGHYMIWNMSEETYDYTYFDNQVLEYNFPGHPAPPLGLIFKICSSIENWLQADDKNLAAVHCLTGKGRTGTVIACYLAWIGQFPNALESLEFVAEKRQTSVEKLTIPSQRRYIQYFNNVMEGVKPRSSPLLLRRVIINTIPVFGERRVLEPAKKELIEEDRSETVGVEGESLTSLAAPGGTETEQGELVEVIEKGCCPYLQVFKSGKLVFTTTWQDMEDGHGIQWASTGDGSLSFNVNCMLQGDILIRCRHLTDAGQRISMFRGAFHTGYIPQGILRLTKAQLDGACNDSRFDQDFFVDLIFADVESEEMSLANHANDDKSGTTPKSEGVSLTEEDRQAYEDMLQRDEVFWQDIEERKKRLQKQREELLNKKMEAEAASIAEAKTKAEAAAEEANMVQSERKQTSFSISGIDEDIVNVQKTTRKGSWDAEKDKELMSELESLTDRDLTNAAKDVEEAKTREVATFASEEGDSNLSKDYDEIQKLEKELASLSDSKIDPQLELLDAELKGLEDLSPLVGDETDDVMNFGADDFEELEEYLSGLSTK
ncbi:phosphatidylinositol--trisphosphate 3 [Plasmopara halstedii]|uniref:Phosphatidylinositol--trisphosphate 3 n=1 Tax=Plasmopara halstedii TaxID=4781 RepID=A0A0P1ANE7_PLAHL|nr:phosphatidylinositol--trisphosphate 3 [Plasmopara halstedii]CEG42645.1 phosphatidylinositol--trisphosphate 3 [Plasmopara halstedii]|eukprot:XP_024579014.1 phosphatidylinositol--trisphosphate 3 [Plasmopara halstedii]